MYLGRALAAVVAGLTLAAGTCVSAVADAPTGSRPVTVADHVEGRAGSTIFVEPLANDSDPDGDPLAICRLGSTPVGVAAEFFDNTVVIETDRSGTFTIDYYACDFEYLAKGTITVVATPAVTVDLNVRKLKRPGKLRVVNHGAYRISFAWGSVKEERADGSHWVKPGHGVTISVKRHSIVWVAVNVREEVTRIGYVRGIRLPGGTKALPAGAPRGGGSSDDFAFRTAPSWRIGAAS